MNRREFIARALAAPAVITTSGLLMPVRKLIEPVDIRSLQLKILSNSVYGKMQPVNMRL